MFTHSQALFKLKNIMLTLEAVFKNTDSIEYTETPGNAQSTPNKAKTNPK
jgi:hypothetical protein